MSETVRAAATVLVLRDSAAGPEVFMVRRHERAAFMARAYVFPGGAVDAADRATDPALVNGLDHARRQLPALDPIDAVAHHVAAVRELFEEAGILLATDRGGVFPDVTNPVIRDRFERHRCDVQTGAATFGRVLAAEDLRAAADALVLVSHWVTPPMVDTRRFDTRFFGARLPPDQHPVHDDRETTDGRWTRASEAIQAAERREIILPPPTWITLRELADFESVAGILAWAASRRVERREPHRLERDGSRVLVMPHPEHVDRWGRADTPFAWFDDRWLPLES
jgi:8-oxo-dGTP pyrophosphatase MutT (NUDIX family)